MSAANYITKPIHWAVLRHRVRHLIQQSLLYKQLQEACRNLERLSSQPSGSLQENEFAVNFA